MKKERKKKNTLKQRKLNVDFDRSTRSIYQKKPKRLVNILTKRLRLENGPIQEKFKFESVKKNKKK